MTEPYFIDDEPILLDLTKIYLERDRDLRVTYFSKASDALEMIKSGERPHLIISDIKMPEMTGFEFAQKLIDGQFLSDRMRFAYSTSFASLDGASDIYGVERKDLLQFPLFKKPITMGLISFIHQHAGK